VILLDASVAVKYPLIVLLATGLTLAAYEAVKRWNVTRWLFGMRLIEGHTSVSSIQKLKQQPR
jgi:hypothetical protein